MGFTGLADVIAMFNYKYGDDDSLLLTDQIIDIIMFLTYNHFLVEPI